jgi:hypothetical protein
MRDGLKIPTPTRVALFAHIILYVHTALYALEALFAHIILYVHEALCARTLYYMYMKRYVRYKHIKYIGETRAPGKAYALRARGRVLSYFQYDAKRSASARRAERIIIYTYSHIHERE